MHLDQILKLLIQRVLGVEARLVGLQSIHRLEGFPRLGCLLVLVSQQRSLAHDLPRSVLIQGQGADGTAWVFRCILDELVQIGVEHDIDGDIRARDLRPCRIEVQQRHESVPVDPHLQELRLDHLAACVFPGLWVVG